MESLYAHTRRELAAKVRPDGNREPAAGHYVVLTPAEMLVWAAATHDFLRLQPGKVRRGPPRRRMHGDKRG